MAMVVPLHTPEVMVPTPVKLEPVTVEFNEVPVKVPASAVTVISLVPLNETPFIFLAVVNLFALLAVPDKVPTKVVDVTELNPVTEVYVPPNAMAVEPSVVELFASCPLAIPALSAKLLVVKPVAEMTPVSLFNEIPDPPLKAILGTLPKPTISFVIPLTVPVNVGDSISAFKLILRDKLTVSFLNLESIHLAVSDIAK